MDFSGEALRRMRTLQINSVLLFMSNYSPVMALAQDGSGEWTWEPWVYKTPPWRHKEYRDLPITVTLGADNRYKVEFHPDEDARETVCDDGDIVRVSFFTDAQEISATAQALYRRIQNTQEEGFLKTAVNVAAGTVIAVRRAPKVAVYSCIADFNVAKEDDKEDYKLTFIPGLVDPENYKGNFQLSSDSSKWDMSVSALSSNVVVKKGQTLRFEAGYWDIFTCVTSYNGTQNHQTGKDNPEDYPGHFVRGVLIGSAPCKGQWKFYCSGTWYGSYEVRASYDGNDDYSADWEYRGEAWSQNAAPSNAPMGGDESSEECFVSLWLTRVRQFGEALTEKCFPSDICGNQLVVNSYKHDMQLKVLSLRNPDGTLVEQMFERVEKIQVEWSGSIESIDWSWSAFCSRYGWPRVACIYNQRLVFAGTLAQPMTVWASQTDDIDNFDIIEADNGAMALTLSGETMEPIRWLEGHNSRIVLGTSRGEYVIQSGDGRALTYANAMVTRHGFNGAADASHIQCEDKVLYIGRGAGRVKQYGYDYAQDAYVSQDLNVFAEHVLEDGGGVKDGCVVKQPHVKAVFVLNNGQMALMTYNSMHQVNAWHRYVTQGEFLSVASMLNDSSGDSLFALVKRLLDEGTPMEQELYCIEVLEGQNDYYDGLQAWDYTSTLLTNALTSTRMGGAKKTPDAVMIYLNGETLAEGVEVTVDGGKEWAVTGVAPSLTIPKGWNSFDGFTTPGYDVEVGFRVKGRHGMEVLALQG